MTTFKVPIWTSLIKGDPITENYHLEMTGEQLAAVLNEYSEPLGKEFGFNSETQELIVYGHT